MTSHTPNPPWVDSVLAKHWEALEARVGVPLMPTCYATREHKPRCPVYGCGSYGCVMATRTDGMVCKVTSDASEAAFVSAYLKLAQKPPGVVRYDHIFELPESYRRRRVFVIWRQAADHVGELYDRKREDVYEDRYGQRSFMDFRFYLNDLRRLAGAVRETVKRSASPAKLLVEASSLADWAGRVFLVTERWPPGMTPARRVAYDVYAVSVIAEQMEGNDCGSLVGAALLAYLERGILLADVHHQNIGEVVPEDYLKWEFVITDPGHMVPLDPKWLDVEVPQLYP